MAVRPGSGPPDPSAQVAPDTASRAAGRRPVRQAWTEGWAALAAYIVIAVILTWPLARGLGRDVAWDLGDSLLVMWIVSWDAEQLLAILSGDFSRAATFFNANIFHPVPLTLAYSEHLLPQALQALPLYALTRNPILVYNLLFLSTFVLSGLGMFLFVRELTGKPVAAFVAGLLFAFAPYRFPQSPHLQVLSSQWMPFALYGFRRYLASVAAGRTRLRPLVGAAAALVVQNLSCGYYLLYFSPFAGAYVLWEIATRTLWRRGKMWVQLSVAAVAVLALTIPFLLPYLALNEQMRFERSRAEVIRFSADVYSYATASGEQFWGDVLRLHPKPEGDLFPGFVPLLLAALAIGASLYTGWRQRRDDSPAVVPGSRLERWSVQSRWMPAVLAAGCVAHLAAVVIGLIYRRVVVDLYVFELRISNVTQMLIRAVIFGVLLMMASPAARRQARAFMRGPGFFALAMIAAMWLSLGPAPQVQGRAVEIFAPYAVLYDHVPGFDGVRAPARLGMIAVLMLAVLGGLGAARLASWRRAWIVLVPLSVSFLIETAVTPFVINGSSPTPGYVQPEPRVYRPARAPDVYKAFERQAPNGVLAELPLGEFDFDLRAVYYSTVHWRPVLNGYSGFYPPHYGRLALALSDVPRFPVPALDALRTYGATHVIVHEAAFLDGRGANTTRTLLEHGATELYRNGGDVLLLLPGATSSSGPT